MWDRLHIYLYTHIYENTHISLHVFKHTYIHTCISKMYRQVINTQIARMKQKCFHNIVRHKFFSELTLCVLIKPQEGKAGVVYLQSSLIHSCSLVAIIIIITVTYPHLESE